MNITVSTSVDAEVAYLTPVKRNGNMSSQLERLGAFFELPSSETMTLPLSTERAQKLRTSLVSFMENFVEVTVVPSSVQVLASYADALSPKQAPIMFASMNGDSTIIDAQLSPIPEYSAIQNALRVAGQMREVSDGIFSVQNSILKSFLEALPTAFRAVFEKQKVVTRLNITSRAPQGGVDPFEGLLDTLAPSPASNASQGRTAAPSFDSKDRMVSPSRGKHHPAPLTLEIEKTEVVLPAMEPFIEYDGTLDSLRDVPLGSYAMLQKDTATTLKKNREIEKSNTNLPQGKRKKPLLKTMAERLHSMGFDTAFDIIHNFPLRYIDRSRPKLIEEMKVGEEGSILAYVTKVDSNHARGYVKMTFEDMARTSFEVTFFRQMYLNRMYHRGDQVILTGKFAVWKGRPQIDSPRIDKLGTDRSSMMMVPIYSQSGKHTITTWDMLKVVKETFSRIAHNPLVDPLGSHVLDKYSIPVRHDAYLHIHFPMGQDSFTDARRRLVYDELLRLQLFIQHAKQSDSLLRGFAQDAPSVLTDAWVQRLPYVPTDAQTRAMSVIAEKMSTTHPLHALVQGDVGSGKSTIASFSVLKAVENGRQALLLAPTEILAEQLYAGLKKDLVGVTHPKTGKPLMVDLLTGRMTAKRDREVREALANGSMNIMVGTHSLVQEGIEIKNLGVVVIDEQHRFGVQQRTALRHYRKDGLTPDMILMTATPIPRSSAMVLYGDMDLILLDELPPNRIPITTRWIRQDTKRAIVDPSLEPWRDIRAEVEKGHQAYIVGSLVDHKLDYEGNSKTEDMGRSIEEIESSLRDHGLRGIRLGKVHGKMKKPERDKVMGQFAAGELDVLIATTVIEVGVNVPNATVMVVVDPNRFGIAQLHQIRGRVGRADLPSRCWLVGDVSSGDGETRLQTIVDSTDGFYLAEKDLELRGEGSLFAEEQSGDSDLYIANLRDHRDVLEVTRNDALAILACDPRLDKTREGKLLGMEGNVLYGKKQIKS